MVALLSYGRLLVRQQNKTQFLHVDSPYRNGVCKSPHRAIIRHNKCHHGKRYKVRIPNALCVCVACIFASHSTALAASRRTCQAAAASVSEGATSGSMPSCAAGVRAVGSAPPSSRHLSVPILTLDRNPAWLQMHIQMASNPLGNILHLQVYSSMQIQFPVALARCPVQAGKTPKWRRPFVLELDMSMMTFAE